MKLTRTSYLSKFEWGVLTATYFPLEENPKSHWFRQELAEFRPGFWYGSFWKFGIALDFPPRKKVFESDASILTGIAVLNVLNFLDWFFTKRVLDAGGVEINLFLSSLNSIWWMLFWKLAVIGTVSFFIWKFRKNPKVLRVLPIGITIYSVVLLWQLFLTLYY